MHCLYKMTIYLMERVLCIPFLLDTYCIRMTLQCFIASFLPNEKHHRKESITKSNIVSHLGGKQTAIEINSIRVSQVCVKI